MEVMRGYRRRGVTVGRGRKRPAEGLCFLPNAFDIRSYAPMCRYRCVTHIYTSMYTLPGGIPPALPLIPSQEKQKPDSESAASAPPKDKKGKTGGRKPKGKEEAAPAPGRGSKKGGGGAGSSRRGGSSSTPKRKKGCFFFLNWMIGRGCRRIST